jgi:diketogulonate reductase-like aldo/keto reductase
MVAEGHTAVLRKPFGVDALSLPAIGIGMGLGGHFKADPCHDIYVDILRLGFLRGMTFVDTAEVYGAGQSERLVSEAIKGIPDEVFVATKVSPENFARSDLLRAADASLARLGTDCIDLYQLHWPNPKVPLDETASALTELVQAGKVRYVGVSNFSLKQLELLRTLLGATPLCSAQVEYNLFDRSIEVDLLPYCQRNAIAVIAYSPLDQGQICGDGEKRRELERIASKYGKTASQVALRWLMSKPGVFVIPKAARREHVEQNASSAEIELSAEDMATIDRMTRYEPVEIDTACIRVVPDDEGRRLVYRTLEEARENRLGLTPSPLELAEDLRAGNFLKPIRVRPSADSRSGFDYELVEGRIRYWAWILSFGPEKPVPALVRR